MMLQQKGFLVITDVFTESELRAIEFVLPVTDSNNPNFRKSADLFAIRQFLKEIPAAFPLLLNANLRRVINDHLGEGYFVVRSIYFDKPASSNWAVPWHQDMTISVGRKVPDPEFKGWTTKHGQYSVCPPLQYMEGITTVRIHLDDTDASNGALKVIPSSHGQGIIRTESRTDTSLSTTVCVPRGGVMLMKPLLLHASDRSTSNGNRRVIHVELSNMELPKGLGWSERMEL